MDVKQWLNQASQDEREAVAVKAGTTVAYLWQLAGDHRKPSPLLARRLEEACEQITPGRVMSKRYTRPDVFGPSPAASSTEAA